MSTCDQIKEADRLAALKSRLAGLASDSPWYPVLERYVGHVSARVRALGGDPEAVTAAGAAPSPIEPVAEPSPELLEYTGRVTEVIRDPSGQVRKVRLSGREGSVLLEAPEQAIGALAAVAHREQLALSVFAEAGPQRRIRNLVFRG